MAKIVKQLVLSSDEVKTLITVLRHTGGDPVSSPRRHVDAMLRTLASLEARVDHFPLDGHLFFDNTKEA